MPKRSTKPESLKDMWEAGQYLAAIKKATEIAGPYPLWEFIGFRPYRYKRLTDAEWPVLRQDLEQWTKKPITTLWMLAGCGAPFKEIKAVLEKVNQDDIDAYEKNVVFQIVRVCQDVDVQMLLEKFNLDLDIVLDDPAIKNKDTDQIKSSAVLGQLDTAF